MLALLWLVGMIVLTVVVVVSVYKKNEHTLKVLAGAAGAAVLWSVLLSITITETGTVKVVHFAGIIRNDVCEEGVSFVVPWLGVKKVNIRRDEINISSSQEEGEDSGGIKSMTSEGVRLSAEVVYPFRVNEVHTPMLLSKVGEEKKYRNLLTNAGKSALRDTLAGMEWKAAAIGKRETFETNLAAALLNVASNDLMKAGFPEDVARKVFIFSDPIVKEMIPPDRITQQIEEEQAAKVELSRQATLTEISEEKAKRRGNDGTAMANLIEELPEDLSIEEATRIIEANAMETRAEALEIQARALQAAVESGQLKSVVFTGAQVTTSTN